MKCYKYIIAISILVASSIIVSYYFIDDKANKNTIIEINRTTNNEDENIDQKKENHNNEINNHPPIQESENTNIPTENTQDASKQAIQQKEEIELLVNPKVTENLPAGEDGNMVLLINDIRVENGFGQLTYDPALYSVADIRLNEISTYFSHTRPDGSEFYTVSSAVDGENLSKYGAGDATSSFNGFMNSQGHRENILYSGFTRVACKKATIGGIVYWIQLFGY